MFVLHSHEEIVIIFVYWMPQTPIFQDFENCENHVGKNSFPFLKNPSQWEGQRKSFARKPFGGIFHLTDAESTTFMNEKKRNTSRKIRAPYNFNQKQNNKIISKETSNK